MALTIDQRLLEPDGEMELMENFNRVLNIVDEIESLPDADDATEGDILTINEDGEAEWTTPTSGSGSALPSVTASDEGKFLIVNASGEWAATTIPIADNMSF